MPKDLPIPWHKYLMCSNVVVFVARYRFCTWTIYNWRAQTTFSNHFKRILFDNTKRLSSCASLWSQSIWRNFPLWLGWRLQLNEPHFWNWGPSLNVKMIVVHLIQCYNETSRDNQKRSFGPQLLETPVGNESLIKLTYRTCFFFNWAATFALPPFPFQAGKEIVFV